MKSRETLKKLFLVNSLLPEVTGNDLYYADQIRQSIEAALRNKTPPKAESDFEQFAWAVARLRRSRPAEPGGFQHWDAAEWRPGFAPLWARTELVSRLKRMAADSEGTLLVTNLAEAVRPRSGRWTRRARAEYDEAITLIRALARRWSTPSARLTLVVC